MRPQQRRVRKKVGWCEAVALDVCPVARSAFQDFKVLSPSSSNFVQISYSTESTLELYRKDPKLTNSFLSSLVWTMLLALAAFSKILLKILSSSDEKAKVESCVLILISSNLEGMEACKAWSRELFDGGRFLPLVDRL